MAQIASKKILALPAVTDVGVTGTDAAPIVAAGVTSRMIISHWALVIGRYFLPAGIAVSFANWISNNRFYNIKDYGAIGDGSADDTFTIQAAATALPSGAILYAPAGSYKINGEIALAVSGVILELGKATFTQIGANKRTFIFTAVSNVKVSGGIFVGKGSEHVGGSTSYNNVAAVYFSGNCTNIDVGYLTATNHAGGDIRWGGGTMQTIRVHHCTLAGIGSAGGIASGDNNDDAAIGSFNTTADNDVTIFANTISDHCFGIFCARGNGLLIILNIIKNIPGQHGMYISQMSVVEISGNVLRSINFIAIKNQIAGDGLTATDILVTGNQIANCGQTGVNTEVTSVSVGSKYQRVMVSNNHIYNITSTYGIATDGCEDCTLRGNTIIKTAAYGIFFNNSFGTIEYNTIKQTEWTAIFGALTNDTDVQYNKIIDCALNTAAAADNNRYRYLVQLNKSAAALVANPVYNESGMTFRYSSGVAEPTLFAGANGRVVRIGTGVFSYVKEAGGRNFTTRTYLFDTTSDNKLWLRPSMSADIGNASKTVTSITEEVMIWDTALSGARTVTLPAASADNNGVRYRVVRTANSTGAFNLNVNDSAAALIKALATASLWAEFQSNGTIFRQIGGGTL